MRSFLLLLMLVVSVAGFLKKTPIPDNFDLIYPVNGSAPANSFVQLGFMQPEGQPEISGVYFNLTLSLTSPNATNQPIMHYTNTNFTSPDFGKSPTRCGGVDGGIIWRNIYLNESGIYNARWNFSWVFPTSVDTTGAVGVCTGTGLSEFYVLERHFLVFGAPSTAAPSTPQPLLQSTTSLLTAWTSAQFAPRPTGTVYTLDSAAPRSMKAVGKAWAGIWIGVILVWGFLLHLA